MDILQGSKLNINLSQELYGQSVNGKLDREIVRRVIRSFLFERVAGKNESQRALREFIPGKVASKFSASCKGFPKPKTQEECDAFLEHQVSMVLKAIVNTREGIEENTQHTRSPLPPVYDPEHDQEKEDVQDERRKQICDLLLQQ